MNNQTIMTKETVDKLLQEFLNSNSLKYGL